jgi:hypothetical protein
MPKREDRERARVMAMLPEEGAVAAEIFATIAKLGSSGDTITPELASLASQVAGAEAAGRWLTDGHSMDDCGMVRRFYEYVGQHIASDVEPGGRLYGSTIPDGDDAEDSQDRTSVGTEALARGIRYEPALDSDPTALIGTAGGFIDGGWNEFRTSRFSTKTDGTWVLNHYPAEGVLALHFMGRNFSGFAEVFKDDIAAARVATKGLNMVVEVVDCNGRTITAVGPRKRLRNIFAQLGHPL